ncbi:MAG: hypothetical protein RIQ81_540, partial [Pseudomonadota bacterium]
MQLQILRSPFSAMALTSMISTVTLMASLAGCRAAGYEIIDPDRKVERPAGPALPETTSYPPSARLEIVQAGKIIGVTRTGTGLTFRPSVDTVDPDYMGKSPCANPGINSGEYQISIDGRVVSSQRDRGCEPLEVNYSFANIGAQVVTLKVVSADGETASSSQVVRVVNTDPCCSVTEPAIAVTAAPLVAYPDEPVNAQARCLNPEPGNIAWDFGNGKKAAGSTSSTTFSKTGQYVI